MAQPLYRFVPIKSLNNSYKKRTIFIYNVNKEAITYILATSKLMPKRSYEKSETMLAHSLCGKYISQAF